MSRNRRFVGMGEAAGDRSAHGGSSKKQDEDEDEDEDDDDGEAMGETRHFRYPDTCVCTGK